MTARPIQGRRAVDAVFCWQVQLFQPLRLWRSTRQYLRRPRSTPPNTFTTCSPAASRLSVKRSSAASGSIQKSRAWQPPRPTQACGPKGLRAPTPACCSSPAAQLSPPHTYICWAAICTLPTMPRLTADGRTPATSFFLSPAARASLCSPITPTRRTARVRSPTTCFCSNPAEAAGPPCSAPRSTRAQTSPTKPSSRRARSSLSPTAPFRKPALSPSTGAARKTIRPTRVSRPLSSAAGSGTQLPSATHLARSPASPTRNNLPRYTLGA